VLTGGQERTNAEHGKLLEAARLNLGKVQPVAFPHGVSEGRAAKAQRHEALEPGRVIAMSSAWRTGRYVRTSTAATDDPRPSPTLT